MRALAPLADHRAIVLIGGQAVAFWARLLGVTETQPELLPLLSKDIDFEGDVHAAEEAAALLGGSARLAGLDDIGPTVALVRFIDADGINRVIDFLVSPLGLAERDVRNTAVRALITDASGAEVPLLLMHPERCMESRIYNVTILGKDGEHQMRQLRASIACAREWSRRLLEDESVPEAERVRAVLRLNERIFNKCIRDARFRELYERHGVDPFEAVVVEHELLPDALRARRYPQMLAALTARRAGE